MFFNYLRLRHRAYVEEIKHALKQLEHILLVIIMFLGTALPALFFSLLLAFGIIFDNQSSLLMLSILVWSLLCAQSILILLLRPAILGSSYALYIETVETNVLVKRLSDLLLVSLSNPILLICLLLIFFIPITHWFALAHVFLTLALLILGTLLCLYKSRAMIICLSMILLAIPVILFIKGQGQSLNIVLSVNIALVFIAYMLDKKMRNIKLIPMNALSIYLIFWGRLFFGLDASNNNRVKAWLICVLACALLSVLTYYCTLSLPEYKNVVIFIGGQLLILFCACLQLSVNKPIKDYSLFIEQYKHNKRFMLYKYFIPFLSYTFLLITWILLFNTWALSLTYGAAILSFYMATKAPNYLILSCLLGTVLSAFLYF